MRVPRGKYGCEKSPRATLKSKIYGSYEGVTGMTRLAALLQRVLWLGS